MHKSREKKLKEQLKENDNIEGYNLTANTAPILPRKFQYSQEEARNEKHKCLNKVPYLGWEKSILYQVGGL